MKYEPERWKSDYDRDGHVVVTDVVDPETLVKLRTAVEKITDDPQRLPPHLLQHIDFEKTDATRSKDVVVEGRKAVFNVMELPLFSPAFAELIVFPPILDILESLFGTSEFAFHNYKCINKAARVGRSFLWHRDLPYLEHSTPNLITAMICLDEMTEANGATVVLPGTHRVPHESVTKADANIPEEKLPAGKRVTCTCPAGSVVLFHVNVIHGGGPNRSDGPRRNLISIWSGRDTYPTTAARYAYQDLMPRSTDPARRKQVKMTFPKLAAGA